LHELLLLKQRRHLRNRISSLYPAEGPLRRELYTKHLEFFRLGASIRERLFMAANRVGKTEGAGGYEVSLHLTGQYPDWWEGRRFRDPVEAWAANDSNLSTRDIVQSVLCGPVGIEPGTGLIPGDLILSYSSKSGVPDGIDSIFVKHVTGGTSILQFKSFEQGRKAWQGTKKQVVWYDEEPPYDVYVEGAMRTASTVPGELGGIVLCTFTPMLGMSQVVLHYMPDGKVEEQQEHNTRRVVMAGWDDVPHLSDKEKQELLATIPPYQRKARTKGIPMLGSGAIYPIDEDDIVVPDFPIPAHWPRGYGFDVGWNATAGVWGALDRETDTLYLYSDYKRGKAEPDVHAAAIKSRGDLYGFADPASLGRGQRDGKQLMKEYVDLGLKLQSAKNAVEGGLFSVLTRMTTGRLKVFKSMVGWLGEFRMYRRDEDGKVVKENDHEMDCTRYLVLMLDFLKFATVVEEPKIDKGDTDARLAAKARHAGAGSSGWMSG
jgi:phage terminase large subunit-like protein